MKIVDQHIEVQKVEREKHKPDGWIQKGVKEITRYENGRVRVRTLNEQDSRTQQQFKDVTDVNLIIAKYRKGEEITHVNRKAGVYADVSQISDFQQALDKVLEAQHAFSTINAETRLRFQNDPAKFIEFLRDPNNEEEAIKMGLVERKPAPKPSLEDTIQELNTTIKSQQKPKKPAPQPEE